MSDSRRRYRAIVTKLEQLYPEAKRRKQQHLAVLAAFISGVVGSRSTHAAGCGIGRGRWQDG